MTEKHLDVTKKLISLASWQISNYRKYKQKSGANFNIFKILRRSSDEVNGHSTFIAELLNPRGAHGLGDVFLHLFFETIGISQHIHGCTQWEVLVEEGKDIDGRIDIFLIGKDDLGRKIGIAIENKIYAEDQPKQLYRYWTHLNIKFPKFKKDDDSIAIPYFLFYLTLDGYIPSKQSIGDIPIVEIQWDKSQRSDEPVRLLSYSHHILKWLKACHEKMSSYPYAREVVLQYIDTINLLTGNGGSMVDELKSLLNTPEKLYAAAKLSGAVIKFKQELLAELWDRIESEWESRNAKEHSVITGHLVANEYADNDRNKVKYKSKEYFTKQREVPRFFGLAAHSYRFQGMPVGLEIRFNGNFYVGIYGINGEKVLPKSVVEEFYKKYQPSKDCKVASDKVIGDKERILVNTLIRFDTDNEAVFKLVEEESKKMLVEKIIEVAEDIIKEMLELGLEINCASKDS